MDTPGPNTPLKFGFIAGGIHLVGIIALATVVLLDPGRGGGSTELWVVANLLDLPLVLLLELLESMPGFSFLATFPSWPNVAFLPGIAGDWNKFLFPFLLFSIFGSALWFLIAWCFGFIAVRYRS
jgi:hypothetical protein